MRCFTSVKPTHIPPDPRVTHLLYCLIFAIFSLPFLIPGSPSSVRAHLSTLKVIKKRQRVHGLRICHNISKHSCGALVANVLVHVPRAHAVLLLPALSRLTSVLQLLVKCWGMVAGAILHLEEEEKRKYTSPSCF